MVVHYYRGGVQVPPGGQGKNGINDKDKWDRKVSNGFKWALVPKGKGAE